MDRCSTELLTLIIEFACSDDFGQTARRVGLVSKYFRTIAGRFEFRAISVSGLNQLEGVLKNLNRTDRSGHLSIDVRHLFINELWKDHALAAEVFFSNGVDYWHTKEGEYWQKVYQSCSSDFWAKVSMVIAKTSPTLRTLFLLTSEHYLMRMGQVVYSKALGALSGATFPRLTSLALSHNALVEVSALTRDHMELLAPTTPSLRKLLIISPVWNSSLDTPLHPLLYSVLQSANSELTYLNVCCDEVEDAETLMGVIFGENWRVEPRKRTLPGKLRSLKLQYKPRAIYHRYVEDDEETEDLVTAVEGLHIDGLVACCPTPRCSEEGRCRYVHLLASWKEQCLESS